MKDTKDTNKTHVNRTYKSTVFAMLFTEKENLLELYNAISGKHYTDPEVCQRDGTGGRGGTGDPGMYRGRDPEGISGETQSGGEEHEHI